MSGYASRLKWGRIALAGIAATVTVAAGALGGLVGDRARPARKPVERSSLDV